MNIEANEEKGSLDEDRGAKDENAGGATELETPGEVQIQHQPSQGTLVCWERFLHVRSIRVLLVENDHSTRHVVSALLRNCNYEVLDAANGLQAWKILQDLTNHVDLVLTGVVMPNLSGIALLCKIMSHKTRKNIPVIMMSSNDSMGLVVMCLSKGAVDFLVKPIRKNELKNLWQHVWRRCHSSSGSGSTESGTQTKKYVKSKGCEKSENSESNDEENDGSNGLTVGGGSDDGSGAQSSWIKQAVEVESSQAMSPMVQAAECQDSMCAQVIRSNAKTSGTKRMHICVSGRGHEQKPPDTVEEDKNLKTNIPKDWESQSDNPVKVPLTLTGPNLKSLSEVKCNTSIKQVAEGRPTPMSECLFEKHEGDCEKTSTPLTDVRESQSVIEVTNILNIGNNATDDLKEPKLEPSLKRLRGVQDTGRSVQDGRYILRHSVQSAFSSRYNTSSNFLKAADGITGSCSIIGNSNEVAKKESVADVQLLLTGSLAYRGSNGVSDNIDMGSTTNKLATQPSIRKDKSKATSTINGLHPSAFKPMKNDLRLSQHRDNPLVRGCSSKELEIQHPHHEKNYHLNHHFHNLEPSSNLDDSELKKLASHDPNFASSSVLGGPIYYSLNGSASGSNRVSNGQNGSNTAISTPENNAESDVGQAGKSGSGDANNTGGGGNKMDENKLAQREAALNKFRLKRKERCFTKKVRYQNRKKLAELRPRVRGQFVKKTGRDSSNDCSDK
ncbi:two-component response regulator-like APRR7 isoform X1 [Primulina huaijiensis]|uniref:two-component response regulator-like APRR7 isoform X1 n=1 Tax=Primulina huaijiensis TaxID=1492673 RepID=UPI003CC74951